MSEVSSSQTDVPNPALVFETLNAFHKSAALRGAIELNLFTRIAEGYRDADSLAQQCHGNARAVRILCDFLVVQGFLAKEGEQYSLTPTAALFLDQRESTYMGGIARFIHSHDLVRAFDDVAEIVRRGTTLLHAGGSVAEEYEGWVEFARCMVPMMAPPAEYIGKLVAELKSGPIRVLDIAAGHGLFGIRVAQANPDATIVAFDWPNVVEVAKENAAAAKIQDRYSVLPGDALSVDFGDGYDVGLVTNFFHHFDRHTCESVMKKIAASLNEGGCVITLEFVPNEDRVSPPVPATFALTMLATTEAGDAYTFTEYDAMWKSAGLVDNQMHDVPNSQQRVIVSRR